MNYLVFLKSPTGILEITVKGVDALPDRWENSTAGEDFIWIGKSVFSRRDIVAIIAADNYGRAAHMGTPTTK